MAVKFVIVGPGRVGGALAFLLHRAGYEFLGAVGRSIKSAHVICEFAGTGRATVEAGELTPEAELTFITTPDDTIAEVAGQIASRDGFAENSVVAHCSGAYPSTILASVRRCGARLGSLHPLQSFATVEQAVSLLPGSFCCVEGEPEACICLQRVAEALGARPFTIPTEGKVLYHAGAVVACNFLVALEDAALRLNEAAGISRREGLQALLPLIRGTVQNLEKLGIPQALTGPIARGDVQTVRRHLEALEEHLPDLLPLYRALGLHTIEVARTRGRLTQQRAQELQRLLQG